MSEELRQEVEALRREMRRESLRTRLGVVAVVALVLAVVPFALRAGAVGSLTTFSNGTVADATSINGNFGALSTAVNDNHARLNSLESGRIRKVTTFRDCTRVVLPMFATRTFASFTVDKQSPTSRLLIQGAISGFGNYSGSLMQEWVYGSTVAGAQSTMYDEGSHSKVMPTGAVIEGHTTTGPQTMVFRYRNITGTVTEKPFNVYNPNATDDSRLGQTCSTYSVIEVEP